MSAWQRCMSAIYLRGQLKGTVIIKTPKFWIQQFLCNHLKEDDDVTRSTMSSQGNPMSNIHSGWFNVVLYQIIFTLSKSRLKVNFNIAYFANENILWLSIETIKGCCNWLEATFVN